MKMHISRDKLRRDIRQDVGLDTDAGIPIQDTGMLKLFVDSKDTRVGEKILQTETVELKHAFGTLIRQLRRERGLNIETLAAKLTIQVEELRAIEHDPNLDPRPRTIHKLAQFFKLPALELMKLSGVAETHDHSFSDQALKFAASSDDLSSLSKKERAILHAFVKFLSSQK